MYNIDKEFEQAAAGLVTRKRKSPLTPILITVAGLAVAFLPEFVPAVGADRDLSAGAMIIGWSAALFGMIRLVIAMVGNSWDFFYIPTGEKLRQYEFAYEASHRDQVRRYAEEGRFDRLAELPRSNISAVKVTAYGIPRKEMLWAQVFEFIPHNHVPLTDVLAYAKGSCPMPAGLK